MPGTYYELIVKGDKKLSTVYLKGFLLGKGIKKGVIFSLEHRFHYHHLKDTIHLHAGYIHLICRAALRVPLLSAIRNSPEDLPLEIVSDRKISRASFVFKFDTFSRQVAAKLKRTFRYLPGDIRLALFEPREEIEPEAKGAEGYAPMHDYHFFGRGAVEGDTEQILIFHRKLLENEFIEAEHISIQY